MFEAAQIRLVLSYCQWAGVLTFGLLFSTAAASLSPLDSPALPAGAAVTAIAEAPDGSVYLGGFGLPFGGQSLGRLRPDGTVDPAFSPSPPILDRIRRLRLLANGQLLVIVDGDDAPDRLLRLNADGSQVSGFTSPSFNGQIFTAVEQADGRLWVAGDSGISGISGRRSLFRLHADGSLDESFAPVLSGNFPRVNSLTLQPDGRMVIGGRLTGVDGVTRRNLARLNPDGSLDTSFAVTMNENSEVWATALRADGSLMVGGSFTTIGGQSRTGLAMLASDGSVLPGFNPASSGAATGILIQPDGHIVLRGESLQIGGISGIVRLRPDGSVDTDFNLAPTGGAILDSIVDVSGTRLLLSGWFGSLQGQALPGLARVGLDGRLQRPLAPQISGGDVLALAVTGSDGILIGGGFTQIDGSPRLRLARLHSDGQLDSAFNPAPDAMVRAVLALPDSGLLVAGDFQNIAGQPASRLARLNPDGTLDTGFPVDVDGPVRALLLQPDGALLIGGSFGAVNGQARANLARLLPTGALDPNFSASSNAAVSTLALDAQGRVLIGGEFSQVNGQARQHLARLLPNGQLDTSFALAADGEVATILVLPDGRVLVGGLFSNLGAQPRARLALLNASGSVNAGFNLGVDGPVRSLAALNNGQLLVAGQFAQIAGTPVNCCVARLNADGSFDSALQAGLNTGSTIHALALQAHGQVLIGGDFFELGGQARPRLARLQAAGERPRQRLVLAPSAAEAFWERVQSGTELVDVRFDTSVDGQSWEELGAAGRVDGGWRLARPDIPQGELFFLRARGWAPSGSGNGSGSQHQLILQAWDNDRLFSDRFESGP